MPRLPDWDVRLAAWASKRLDAPFVWGQTNCIQLALEGFDALTGAEVAAEYRGRYATEREGRLLMRREDIDLIRKLRALGCTGVPVGYQQRGDLLCWINGPRHYAAVCFGERSLASRPETGVAWFDTAATLSCGLGTTILRLP